MSSKVLLQYLHGYFFVSCIRFASFVLVEDEVDASGLWCCLVLSVDKDAIGAFAKGVIECFFAFYKRVVLFWRYGLVGAVVDVLHFGTLLTTCSYSLRSPFFRSFLVRFGISYSS